MSSEVTPPVELHDGYLRVRFPEAYHADFHFRWLRHNCDVDRHPQTNERVVDSSELPTSLIVSRARLEGDELVVLWAHDGRESHYRLDWLRAHAYAVDRVRVEPPPNDLLPITVERAGHSLETVVERALDLVRTRGAAIVRRSISSTLSPEDETEAIVDAFAAAGLAVIGTHFGRIEDLRTDNTTNKNTDQLGYTNAGVNLHTDQPFIDRPPRYQLLESIRPAEEGGDNFVADALAAARYLASIDARAYELLRTTPVRFHRVQKSFESLVVAPILGEFDGHFQVRYSYFTMDPYSLPFAEMEEWYSAYDKFARLVRDPKHHYAFRLEPGDFLLYDNHRMLHARTAFRGARWVRGIYFDEPT
jgi:gamma-butyrobetaine dioxygenase